MNETTATAVQQAYNLIGSWRQLAARMNNVVSHATLNSIANGDTKAVGFRKENQIRKALGLKPIYVPIEPCPACGEAHTHDCSTHRTVRKHGQRRRKKRKTIEIDADLWTLYSMERRRRDLTNNETIASLLGVE